MQLYCLSFLEIKMFLKKRLKKQIFKITVQL